MVWGLFPVDPLPGENEYYIFRNGTYKVGRKGCDIIINKDKGVSRVHAEIIVDEMVCMDNSGKQRSKNPSKVRIRDCSKYGTFVNKNLASMEKVHEFPNKETTLKEGDMVAFGTGNAKYRFSFVSLVLCTSTSKPSDMNQLQGKMSMIGGSITQTWTSKCTHMVIEDFISISDVIIDAVLAGKPLVAFTWIEVIAGKTICTEIPSCALHAPTLCLDGTSLKVADSQSREQSLKGYTFLLLSIQKYKFKEKLQMLLELAGAKAVCVETQDSCNQNPGEKLVRVVPAGSTGSTGSYNKFGSLHMVNEMDLISAVISGHLDPSILSLGPVVITSSCSTTETDETVVADSDVEMESATSAHKSVAINLLESAEDECTKNIEIPKTESSKEVFGPQNAIHVLESSEHESQIFQPLSRGTLKSNDSPLRTAVQSEGEYVTSSRNREEDIAARKDKGIASESDNTDIIYSQDLIVRHTTKTQLGHSSTKGAAVNFKSFRKTDTATGNSFHNLIPFAKNPYEEPDYGNEDVAESIKEENKRKRMEAIADDLFNNEKGRRRAASGAASGSLHRLFARG